MAKLKEINNPSYSLELTHDEAQALVEIFAKVGGDSNISSTAIDIYTQLTNKGFKFNPNLGRGSLYFYANNKSFS